MQPAEAQDFFLFTGGRRRRYRDSPDQDSRMAEL
jgi:hypothetical protein